MAAVTDTRIENVKAQTLQMMELVALSVKESVRSLEDRDVDMAKGVIARDEQIDKLERQIEAQCLDVLTEKIEIKPLRLVVATYKIIGDVERIGDYCVAVANVTLAVANKPITSSALGITKMCQLILEMLKVSMDAYAGKSSINVQEIFDKDLQIDHLYDDIFANAITSALHDPKIITNVIYVIVAARALERAGDHVTNIAERVQFIETGKLVQRTVPIHVPEFPWTGVEHGDQSCRI